MQINYYMEKMGVKLVDILKSEEISIEQCSNKIIAIDAYNAIYQFLSSIRQYDGTPLMDSKGRITSHLSGLFYRTAKLMENNIKPVFVFDGKHPDFKTSEQERRREVREEAMTEWKRALSKGDYENAKKYAKASSIITTEIIEQSKIIVEAMGIPIVQAPSEGEAQAAVMVQKGLCYAAASQDYDSLLFGAPILIRNLSITGKRKVFGRGYVQINPEKIELQKNLENLGITRDQLIVMGILIGTDFDPGGIKGIGPKKALSIVKKYNNIDDVFKEVGWNFKTPYEKIFDFFKTPPYKDPENMEFKEPDDEKIKKILCDEYEFSVDRIEKVLNELKKKRNSSLNKWF